MSQIKSIKLPSGKIILMETDENIIMPDLSALSETEQDESGLRAKGEWSDTAMKKLQDLSGTLESLAAFIPSAIKQAGGANVEKVIFKFGVKLGGEAGIPYITKGSVEGNIEIEIDCVFPKDET
jgi:hypothetical protein